MTAQSDDQMTCRARLASRFPPLLSRWRTVLPLEACTGRDPAEFGEGAVAGDPVLVVTDRGQQRGGGVWADSVDRAQLWCGGGSDGVDVVFEPGGFGVEVLAACRQ